MSDSALFQIHYYVYRHITVSIHGEDFVYNRGFIGIDDYFLVYHLIPIQNFATAE